MATDYSTFASSEVASFWRAINSTVTRLIATLDGLSAEELNWQPPAPEANSLYVLAIHTMGNVEENVLETLCGQPVNRQRDQEFVGGGTSVEAVQRRWQSLQRRIDETLISVPSSELDRSFKHPGREQESGRDVLILVARHAGEHAGQAELTRDLLRASQQRG
ncbi:MAG TPA: DinB family protein [Nitrolancea sp.]|jgi:hypothetical protein|nr:DinB family protein [Nitrolancea sp.]